MYFNHYSSLGALFLDLPNISKIVTEGQVTASFDVQLDKSKNAVESALRTKQNLSNIHDTYDLPVYKMLTYESYRALIDNRFNLCSEANSHNIRLRCNKETPATLAINSANIVADTDWVPISNLNGGCTVSVNTFVVRLQVRVVINLNVYRAAYEHLANISFAGYTDISPQRMIAVMDRDINEMLAAVCADRVDLLKHFLTSNLDWKLLLSTAVRSRSTNVIQFLLTTNQYSTYEIIDAYMPIGDTESCVAMLEFASGKDYVAQKTNYSQRAKQMHKIVNESELDLKPK